MLSADELKFAIEDARARHEADVALICFNDNQAMTLLGYYGTVGIAASSGAAAGLAGTITIPNAVTTALLGVAVALLIGSAFCVWAMRHADISLPGRAADFWIWAQRPEVTMDHACAEYLRDLDQKMRNNDKINVHGAAWLWRAKICGLVAPAFAVVVALGARMLGL
jgi:hypothetical protein